MQKLSSILFSIVIFFFALHIVPVNVYADQLNTVKDCYDNPKNCSEDILKGQDSDSEKKQSTDNKTVEKATENESVGVTIWDFIKMIFATIFVVALLYFLLKFINSKSRRFQSNQLVENLGGASLGANRSLQLVKVGNRIFVVGVGENVQLIKEIDDKDEVANLLTEYNQKIEQLTGPSDIVTKVFKRTKEAASKNTESSKSQSFSAVFQKQLGELSKGRKKVFEEMKKEVSDKHE